MNAVLARSPEAPPGSPAPAEPLLAESPPPPRLARVLRAVDDAVGRVEQVLLVLLLVTLVGVGTLQALATKLGHGWLWSFELIRYAVFFIAMTGAALAAHTEQMLAMDLVPRLLAPRPRAWLRVVLRLFAMVVCALLAAGGVLLADTATGEPMYHLVEPRLGLLALPAGAILIGFHLLMHTLIDLVYLLRGALPPGPRAPLAR